MFSGIKWIPVAIASVATFLLCLMLHTLDVHRIEADWKQKVEDQKTADNKSCAAEKAVTKGVADDFQTKNADLNKRLADLKRVRPSRCIMPASDPAVGNNGGTGGTVVAGTYGVTTDALFDFAGEAERYRLQVISLQKFINQTWKLKEQP